MFNPVKDPSPPPSCFWELTPIVLSISFNSPERESCKGAGLPGEEGDAGIIPRPLPPRRGDLDFPPKLLFSRVGEWDNDNDLAKSSTS